MRRILIVSPHWPPVNAPDMQRVRMSLPWYRASGWEPVVLAVDPVHVDAVLEPELEDTVPREIEVHRARAVPVGLGRAFGVGNVGLRAWASLFAAGLRLLRRERFDLVFFSNTQFATFALGRIWRRLAGVPYVLDVQDPWRTDAYERPGASAPPGGWKYGFARAMAAALEGWSFRRASGVMSVSPRYLETLATRYPWFARIPSAVIPFGASVADQAAAGVAQARALREAGDVNVVYTGAAGPAMPDALTVFFRSLRAFRDARPAEAARLRVHFLGTTYAAPGKGRNAVLPLAAAHGVGDLVRETPHRLGHLESIRLQRTADVLLLAGSRDPAYSPSKTYPYLLSGRPVIALVFKGSVLEVLLEELGCPELVRLDPEGPNAAAVGRLSDLLGRAANGGLAPPNATRALSEGFLAESLTSRQCALFEAASGNDK